MVGTHDAPLVCLSVLVAVAASYTALDLAGRARESRAAGIWLVAAAAAMGGGIWAMHFVAMLAYQVPGMAFGYDAGLTLVSLVVAVGATLAGFMVVNRPGLTRLRLIGAGSFMGAGVVAMHYIGMAAMRMPVTLGYDPRWVAASIVVAVVAATAALWLAFRRRGGVERVVASLVMGAAVSGMHYSAMAGAIFAPMAPGGRGSTDLPLGIDQTSLALGVSVASLAILAMALAASVFDRRIAEFSDREASALRSSEERFRSLYRGTPLPLHSLDRDGRIDQVSDTWLVLTGYARLDVVGRPLSDFVTPDSAGRMLGDDARALLEHGFLFEREYVLVTQPGALRHVLMSASLVRAADGSVVGVLGGMTDVTERRLAEEALRQAQKLEAIGQLTGGVAHDFNNLLAIVVGNLDMVRRRVADEPRTLRLVDNAMEGAKRGASLTQRLLAFARRQDLNPAAVDVPALVEGMSDLLRRSLGPMVRVETSFARVLPRARVDAHQLEMAILNLAVNARDAMADDGLLLIGAAEVSVGEGAGLEPGRYLRVEVTDDGCGMDADTLARANEPFFTTKGVGKGTGLGLSMAQGLAAQSGGRLDLRSRVGFGTTVDLLLPVALGDAAVVEASTASSPLEPLRPLLILVVDDDHLVRENTVAMLEDLGHRVRAASSGSEALVKAAGLPGLDLVVTDQLMPGMTGLQLADSLATEHPYLPVLLASGYSEVADEPGRRLPILAKPFNQAALQAAVRSAVLSAKVVDLDRRRSARV